MTKCNGVDINATIVWSWIFDRMERERDQKTNINESIFWADDGLFFPSSKSIQYRFSGTVDLC